MGSLCKADFQVAQKRVDSDEENINGGPQFSESFPYMGIAHGVISAVAQRYSDNRPLDLKQDKKLCYSAFSGYPVLRGINAFKQWEIKNLSLLTPFLIPFSIQVAFDAVCEKSDEKLLSRVQTAIRRNLTLEQMTDLAAISAFGLIKVYQPSDFLPEDFDASGHMMLKVSLAFLTSKTIAVLSTRGNHGLRNLCFAVNALADAVLVYNTVNNCHTVSEVAAGAAWGLGILGISRITATAIRTFQGMSKAEKLDALYDASVRLLSFSPQKAIERIDFFKRFMGMV